MLIRIPKMANIAFLSTQDFALCWHITPFQGCEDEYQYTKSLFFKNQHILEKHPRHFLPVTRVTLR